MPTVRPGVTGDLSSEVAQSRVTGLDGSRVTGFRGSKVTGKPGVGNVVIAATTGAATGAGVSATVNASAAAQLVYRSTSQRLFVDADASAPSQRVSGLMVLPARSSVAAPVEDFLIGTYGPHRSYVDARSQWVWANPGGDWINTGGTPQSTSSPHATFAANAVTSGASTYSGVDIAAGVQAAFRRQKWNAYIARLTAGTRSIAALHHPSSPAPSITVTYTDGTTATLACVACVELRVGTSYTQPGDIESPVSSTATVAIEFEMPTKLVASATLSMTVTQHTATAATVQLFLAAPPQNTAGRSEGIARSYVLDAGISAHPSVLFAQNYADGSTLSDWVMPTAISAFAIANWDPSLWGGAVDTTKLPTAFSGTAIAGSNKWFHKQSAFVGNLSLVSSSYAGDNFAPIAPGIGALRIVMPGSTAADGANVGATGSTGSDLWYLFPKAISGLVSETYCRFAVRFAWRPRTVADTKMYRTSSGGTAKYTVPTGKWGVGAHHWTTYGGNNRAGGDNLGWSNRMGYEEIPADLPLGGFRPYVHSLDMNPFDTGLVDMQIGGDGLGSGFAPDRWYEIEVRCKLNTYNAAGAIGTSPKDGVMQVWIDGRLAMTTTGWAYRDGALDYTTTPLTSFAPYRELGAIGIALNTYNGGIIAPDHDLVMFIGPTVAGTSYIGPMRRAAPSWQPAAGAATSIGYNSGTHPQGLPATFANLAPSLQPWNSTPGSGSPWERGTVHPWETTAGAYGGFCYSETERRFYSVGHGHVAACLPVPVYFDVASLGWGFSDTPPPSDGLNLTTVVPITAANIAANYPATQFDTTWGDWLGDYSGWGAYKRPGRVFPETGHEYHLTVWIPGHAAGNINGLILKCAMPTGNKSSTQLIGGKHSFDLDTGRWLRNVNGVAAANGACGGACFVSGVKKVFHLSREASGATATLDVFDPLTRTWSQTTATAALNIPLDGGGLRDHPPSGLVMCIVPADASNTITYVNAVKHRIFVVDGATAAAGSHTWAELTITASSWPLLATTDYGPNLIPTNTWTFCPVDGNYYAINGADGSTTLWKLAPPAGAVTQADYRTGAWTVSTQTLSAPIVSKSYGSGASTGAKFIYGRLAWDAQSRCLLFVPNYQYGRVQAIRPSGV